MKSIRKGLRPALAIWTLAAVVVGLSLALQAIWSLYSTDQACFLNYPSVPCPDPRGSDVARLTFALVGVPLIWLAGFSIAVARATRHRRDE